MNKYKFMQAGAVAIVLAGLALLAPYGYFWLRNAQAAEIPAPVVSESVQLRPETISGKPVSVSVPSLGITLPVADGVYSPDTQAWTLSNDKAHFALPSVQPNDQAGNTHIYGHALPQVFGKLPRVATGAEAFVDTNNGYRFTYVFRGLETVEPSNTSIFAYTGKPQLTLQTCSGFWWQDRQLFYFDLVSVVKIT